jgi:hypothetical protein
MTDPYSEQTHIQNRPIFRTDLYRLLADQYQQEVIQPPQTKELDLEVFEFIRISF